VSSDVHTLAGAYALHALPEDEARAFRRHLAMCPSCQEEVEGYLRTAAALGAAEAAPAPTGLRQAVLDAVEVTPQLRPATRTALDWRTRLQLLLAPVAAALALAFVLAGALTLQQREHLQDLRAEHRATTAALLAVVGAPDSEQLRLAGEGTATLVWSPSRRRAVLVASGLPLLDEEQVFQLWFLRDGTPLPSQVFRTDLDGVGFAVVEAPEDFEGAAVTVEPAGGVAAPTGPMVLAPV
jgi:anti-sigma-K factor RskA